MNFRLTIKKLNYKMLLKSAKLCDFFAYQKFNKNLFSSGNRIMEVESVCVCVYEFRNISCQFK